MALSSVAVAHSPALAREGYACRKATRDYSPIRGERNEREKMKYYSVGISAFVNVEAEDWEQAIELAREIVVRGEIKLSEYDFEAHDREID